MRLVQTNDLIIHLIDNLEFVGISEVACDLITDFFCLPNTEWDNGYGRRPGYLIKLKNFQKFKNSITKYDILNKKYKNRLLNIKNQDYSLFYTKNLNLVQGGYLTEVPYSLLAIINEEFKQKNGYNLPLLNIEKIKEDKNQDEFEEKKENWYTEILSLVEKINDEKFSLEDIYKYEEYLRTKFPKNHFIKEKIRQQLQVIRDNGIIEFLGDGKYKRINKNKVKKINPLEEIYEEKQKIQTYSSGLRRNIEGYNGKFANIIKYVPDFYDLYESLLKEKKFDKHTRSIINSVVAYFVLPDDVISEEKFGAYGYIDDLYLCVYALSKLYLEKEVINKHWKRSGDVFELASNIKNEIDNAPEDMIKKEKLNLTIDYIRSLTGFQKEQKPIEKSIEKTYEKGDTKAKQIVEYDNNFYFVRETGPYLELIDKKTGFPSLTLNKNTHEFRPRNSVKTNYLNEKDEVVLSEKKTVENNKKIVEYDSDIYIVKERGNRLELIPRDDDANKEIMTFHKDYYTLVPKIVSDISNLRKKDYSENTINRNDEDSDQEDDN